MSKTKTSMQITRNFSKVFRAGYCELSHIFRNFDPQFYNCGVYGWNCDLYADYENDVIITTGYRNMRGEMIPAELIDRYNDKASKINKEFSLKSYPELCHAFAELRREFFAELASL